MPGAAAVEVFLLRRVGHLDQALHEDAGGDHGLGVDPARGTIRLTWAMVVAAAMHISGLKFRAAIR